MRSLIGLRALPVSLPARTTVVHAAHRLCPRRRVFRPQSPTSTSTSLRRPVLSIGVTAANMDPPHRLARCTVRPYLTHPQNAVIPNRLYRATPTDVIILFACGYVNTHLPVFALCSVPHGLWRSPGGQVLSRRFLDRLGEVFEVGLGASITGLIAGLQAWFLPWPGWFPLFSMTSRGCLPARRSRGPRSQIRQNDLTGQGGGGRLSRFWFLCRFGRWIWGTMIP
jgi:hypothetical protein